MCVFFSFRRNHIIELLLSVHPPNSLTPWNRIIFEKLTVTKLVLKFPAFYGTRFHREFVNSKALCHISLQVLFYGGKL
jgi:hypothetical protein